MVHEKAGHDRERGELLVTVSGVQSVQDRRHEHLAIAQGHRVADGRQGQRVGRGSRAAGDDQRMPIVALLRQRRDAGRPEHRHQVEVIQLIGNREGQDGEVGQGTLGLQGQGRLGTVLRAVKERPLADHVVAPIEEPVEGVQAQARHAHVVRVGVDQGDGQSSAPVLDDGAFFAGQPLANGGQAFPLGHIFLPEALYRTVG